MTTLTATAVTSPVTEIPALSPERERVAELPAGLGLVC